MIGSEPMVEGLSSHAVERGNQPEDHHSCMALLSVTCSVDMLAMTVEALQWLQEKREEMCHPAGRS